MGNKIFVGGLNWRTTEPDLKVAFSRYAEVSSVRIIIDRETGRSKCFGFVEFTEQDAVAQVIEKCDGMKLDGRNIKVSIAKERPAPAEPAKISDETDGAEETSDFEEVDSSLKSVEQSEVKVQAEKSGNGETNAQA